VYADPRRWETKIGMLHRTIILLRGYLTKRDI
jgi:hypothetical protein